MHLAVGEQLPALLTRWNTEPPAIRYVLACLAALYPQHGQQIVEDVAAMATEYAGRRLGSTCNSPKHSCVPTTRAR
ncbi:hypothetical protein C8D88_101686 [Lentzea atacamensis]|uniref:Uncharacterized protein n=1 Tax=Lentzea atacamensis TaxID=531938 RepID=A0A316IK11_9PSEU|nr:hypothetical protein C8D88_101686 [Lentzea atacamensis]